MLSSSTTTGRQWDESTGLARYFHTVRSHIKLIVACVIVCLAAAVAYVEVAPRTYTATSEMVVNPASTDDTVLFSLPVFHSTGEPTQDVLTAASLLHSPNIAQATIRALKLHMSAADLLNKTSIVPFGQSNIVSVSVTASTGASAQKIANRYATEAVAVRTQALHKAIAAILPGIRTSAARLPTAEAQSSGGLGQQLNELEQLETEPDPTVAVSSQALLPTSPTSPKKSLSLVAGLLVGLLIGGGAAFAVDALDPTVRREEQLRERFSNPVLARIPHRPGPAKAGPLTPQDLPFRATEQYRQLRATLASRSDEPAAYLLTGSAPAEGKTTSALNLAAVLAQGGDDVILIEGDLRRPTIGHALGMTKFTSTETVLRGRVDLADALQPVDIGPARFRMLAARGDSHEDAGRLSAHTAAELVKRAKQLADIVIIDSPPITAVVDALAFAQSADRVVLAVRIGHSKLSKVAEAVELLESQGSARAGFILIDVHQEQDLTYGYSSEREPGMSSTGAANGQVPPLQIGRIPSRRS